MWDMSWPSDLQKPVNLQEPDLQWETSSFLVTSLGFLLTSPLSRVGSCLAWRKPGHLREEVSFLLPLTVGWDHALHGGSLALSGKKQPPCGKRCTVRRTWVRHGTTQATQQHLGLSPSARRTESQSPVKASVLALREGRGSMRGKGSRTHKPWSQKQPDPLRVEQVHSHRRG